MLVLCLRASSLIGIPRLRLQLVSKQKKERKKRVSWAQVDLLRAASLTRPGRVPQLSAHTRNRNSSKKKENGIYFTFSHFAHQKVLSFHLKRSYKVQPTASQTEKVKSTLSSIHFGLASTRWSRTFSFRDIGDSLMIDSLLFQPQNIYIKEVYRRQK